MVLNEQEQAKQELMHFGMRGMRWGMRKADARAGLHVGVSKKAMVPGRKSLAKSKAKKDAKVDARFEAHLKASHDRLESYRSQLRGQVKDINAGPGNRFVKTFKALNADHQLAKKFYKADAKAEEKYLANEKSRDSRVKAKQDALANNLKNQMDAEIKIAKSKGGIVERILNPITIEMKYTEQLVSGMGKIDADED
jgi:hypothetical protein